MTPAEIAGLLASGALTIVVGVLGFFLKQALADIRENAKQIAAHDTKIEILKASGLPERVQSHDRELAELRAMFAGLQSDTRSVREWVDEQKRADRHRRREDTKEFDK